MSEPFEGKCPTCGQRHHREGDSSVARIVELEREVQLLTVAGGLEMKRADAAESERSRQQSRAERAEGLLQDAVRQRDEVAQELAVWRAKFSSPEIVERELDYLRRNLSLTAAACDQAREQRDALGEKLDKSEAKLPAFAERIQVLAGDSMRERDTRISAEAKLAAVTPLVVAAHEMRTLKYDGAASQREYLDSVQRLYKAALDLGDSDGVLAALDRAMGTAPEEAQWLLDAARKHANSGSYSARQELEDAAAAYTSAVERFDRDLEGNPIDARALSMRSPDR
jgi:tetratricopeptide (TPR) repeat protein